MVIYAQRIRYGMGTLGVASGVPALHGPAGQPCAWLRRQESSVLGSAKLRATALPVIALPMTNASTLKRDAFAGVSSGLHSTEPPV